MQSSGILRAYVRSATWGGSQVTLSDSNLTAVSLATEDFVRHASNAALDLRMELWYPGTSAIDSVTQSTGSTIFVVEDGNLVGYELYGELWADAMDQFTADTAAVPALRLGAKSDSPSTLNRPSNSGCDVDRGEASWSPQPLALMVPELPDCESERRAYWISVGAFGVAGIVAIKSCDNPLGWLVSCGRAIGFVDSAFAAVQISAAAYAVCKANSGGVALRAPDPSLTPGA